MSLGTQHEHYGIKIGTTLVPGIRDVDHPVNAEVQSEGLDGAMYAEKAYMVGAKPTAGFTSAGIRDMLAGIVAESGTVMGGLSLATAALTTYARKHVDGGGRAGAASHRSFTMNKGILIPQTLECSHGRMASLTMKALITFDGVNAPIVIADAVTLPSVVSDQYRYGLGPIKFGNILIVGVERVSIDFGLNAEAHGADGDMYPDIVSIRRQKPRITLTGKKITIVDDATGIPQMGKPALDSDTYIYFRRYLADQSGSVLATAGFHPNVSTEHVKIVAQGLVWPSNLFKSDGGSPATMDLELVCHGDSAGGDEPLVVTTGVAIT